MTGNLLSGGDFLHAVQCTSSLEPCDLQVVEAVVQLNLFGLSVSVLDFSSQLLARCKAVETEDRDFIGWLDLKRDKSENRVIQWNILVISPYRNQQR